MKSKTKVTKKDLPPNLTKKEKKHLKEIVQAFENIIYKGTGMSMINGGYAEAYMEDYNHDEIMITVEWGEQDMGSGNSSQHTERYLLPRKIMGTDISIEEAIKNIKADE